jgi:tetratricopeptide (TPR) repeat protein
MGNLIDTYAALGRWDDVIAVEAEIPDDVDLAATAMLGATFAWVARHRGDLEMAERALERAASLESSATLQDQRTYAVTKYSVLMAKGLVNEALECAQLMAGSEAAEFQDLALGIVEPAIALGNVDLAAEVLAKLESLPPGEIHVVTRAETQAARAQIAAAQGDVQKAGDSFRMAASTFREYGLPFHVARTLVEHCEWLAAQGRTDEAEPLMAEAEEILERLGAQPWLERLARVGRRAAVSA